MQRFNFSRLSGLSSRMSMKDSIEEKIIEKTDCDIKRLMIMKNKEGLTTLERCFEILALEKDPFFVIFILTNIPRIKRYLHMPNQVSGQLPIFRALHYFKKQLYARNEINVDKDTTVKLAQKLMNILFDVDFDFLQDSNFNAPPGLKNVNTLQMMLISGVDMKFIFQIIHFLYENEPSKVAYIMSKIDDGTKNIEDEFWQCSDDFLHKLHYDAKEAKQMMGKEMRNEAKAKKKKQEEKIKAMAEKELDKFQKGDKAGAKLF